MWQSFQLRAYHGGIKLHFDEMMMFALYYTNTLNSVFKVLAHPLWMKKYSASRYVTPLRHSILIPSQLLYILLNDACLAEKQRIPMLWSLVWPNRAGTHDLPLANHYTAFVVLHLRNKDHRPYLFNDKYYHCFFFFRKTIWYQ
jgi:hypothetical protein